MNMTTNQEIVLIAITPFHIIQFNEVLKCVLNEEIVKISIFHSSFIKSDFITSTLNNYKISRIELISEGEISINELKNYPIKTIFNTRKIISSYKIQINNFLKNTPNKIIIVSGSDKSKYDQIFYSLASKDNKVKKIILVDEGTALYISNTFKDSIINILYYLFSFALFGIRIRFTKAMGRDRRINEIYARRIDLIPNKKTNIIYININNNLLIDDSNIENAEKTLILSSPYSEDHLLTYEYENKVISSVLDKLEKYSCNVHIKPHPRENVGKFSKWENNYKIIDKSIPSEKINYAEYKAIINFGSSAMFDIVLRGYPIQNTLTILSTENKQLKHIFDSINLLIVPFKDSSYQIKINQFISGLDN